MGTATIDKKNDGLSKGTSGSTSINFDRQSRELLTSEEISRMPDEDCIIFISGEKPIYDKKYNTQDMKEFKEAKTWVLMFRIFVLKKLKVEDMSL